MQGTQPEVGVEKELVPAKKKITLSEEQEMCLWRLVDYAVNNQNAAGWTQDQINFGSDLRNNALKNPNE